MREVILFRDVVKNFGGTTILDGIDLSVRKGEFVVIFGEVGVGKSTLVKMAYFQEFPDEGEVSVLSTPHTLARRNRKVLQEVRRKIGVIKQMPVHLEDMTCYENVLYVLERLGFNRRVARERTERALARVGLTHRKDAYPSELSAGQRQKLAIARAIAKEPVILLADDPTLGLDERSSAEIERLFMEINEYGTTVLWTSNRIPKTVGKADDVSIYRLAEGRLHQVP
ncbi:MAG: ATP-binding cassette domain-containing protein [Thermotogae bacterium]|nr:ATP-binding cassette domain-containing protein [Thermotogota bacterium]